MRELEYYRGREMAGVEELARVAAGLIERQNLAATRGNVRLVITPRIVRHYLSEGLLGEPSGQAGAATVFNYGNLLRLLAVKKLLIENWSIAKIRELMSALDITALEQYVSGRPALRPTRVPAPEPVPRALPRPGSPPRPVSLFGPPSGPNALADLARETARRAAEAAWVELSPGLEVRVRRGFRVPRSDAGRERLVERFRAVALGESIENDPHE